MSTVRRIVLLGIVHCILICHVNSSSVQADEGSTILENLIGKSRDELFDLANEKYRARDDLEAAIYLAALIGRCRSFRESSCSTLPAAGSQTKYCGKISDSRRHGRGLRLPGGRTDGWKAWKDNSTSYLLLRPEGWFAYTRG